MSTNASNSGSHGIRLYPCDRGMGGLGVGYHEFTHSGGIIICRYCGKRPNTESSAVRA